jgi:hypothetical protein
MKDADIERLKQIDPATLEHLAQLPAAVQAQVIRLVGGPAIDPKVPLADREIAKAQARRLKAVAKKRRKKKT